MKNLLRLEEFAMFIGCVYLLSQHQSHWWVYLMLVLGPDVGMLGYLVNNRLGATTYNLLHHKGVAVAVFAAGFFSQNLNLQLLGLILFGHSSMDRMFGYGLKYFTGFRDTHLGLIGKMKKG